MPASLTRPCASCKRDRVTPDDFREPGVTGPGRPPINCRECRETKPELAEAYERQKLQRPGLLARNDRYRARSADEVARIQREKYPDGLKPCPPIAGCGLLLPLEDFRPVASQPDGLASVCLSCAADHASIRAHR